MQILLLVKHTSLAELLYSLTQVWMKVQAHCALSYATTWNTRKDFIYPHGQESDVLERPSLARVPPLQFIFDNTSKLQMKISCFRLLEAVA